MQNQSGKGSKPRPFSSYQEYSKNWDEINWSVSKDAQPDKETDETREEYCGCLDCQCK